jgi:hypothetical protein
MHNSFNGEVPTDMIPSMLLNVTLLRIRLTSAARGEEQGSGISDGYAIEQGGGLLAEVVKRHRMPESENGRSSKFDLVAKRSELEHSKGIQSLRQRSLFDCGLEHKYCSLDDFIGLESVAYLDEPLEVFHDYLYKRRTLRQGEFDEESNHFAAVLEVYR